MTWKAHGLNPEAPHRIVLSAETVSTETMLRGVEVGVKARATCQDCTWVVEGDLYSISGRSASHAIDTRLTDLAIALMFEAADKDVTDKLVAARQS